MRCSLVGATVLLALAGCTGAGDDTSDTSDTADTGDTGDTDSDDSGDTDSGDSGDTGADTSDTSDTGDTDTNDTSDTGDTAETVVFDGTDHELDPSAIRVATNTQTAEASGGFFIEAALNDLGVLYVTTQATHSSDRDHFVFVWIDEPAATALVAPPWSKSATYSVAGPGAGALLVLAREGTSSHFCGWLRWDGDSWEGVSTGVTCASGDPASTPTWPRMEGTIDLLAAMGVANVGLLPQTIAFAAVPFDTQDGGNSWGNPFQTPYVPSDGDLGLDDDEAEWLSIDTLLVGGAPPAGGSGE